MAMPRSFIGGPRTFKPHVKFIMGVDSCCAIFATNTNAPMCILIGKFPTIGGF
jgi:hypothetical protein